MTQADRTRRYRQRQNAPRGGQIVLPVEVNHIPLIEALLDAGRLEETQCGDRSALSAAVQKIVGDWQKTVTRSLRRHPAKG